MKTILTVAITAVVTLMLFGGGRAPVQANPGVKAQSANPRGDLVTLLRQDVGNFNAAMDSFVAHRAEVQGRNITFVTGDMTGSNSNGSMVAADVNQVIVDFQTIVTAVRSGGTIAVGVWGNCLKIK